MKLCVSACLDCHLCTKWSGYLWIQRRWSYNNWNSLLPITEQVSVFKNLPARRSTSSHRPTLIFNVCLEVFWQELRTHQQPQVVVPLVTDSSTTVSGSRSAEGALPPLSPEKLWSFTVSANLRIWVSSRQKSFAEVKQASEKLRCLPIFCSSCSVTVWGKSAYKYR